MRLCVRLPVPPRPVGGRCQDAGGRERRTKVMCRGKGCYIHSFICLMLLWQNLEDKRMIFFRGRGRSGRCAHMCFGDSLEVGMGERSRRCLELKEYRCSGVGSETTTHPGLPSTSSKSHGICVFFVVFCFCLFLGGGLLFFVKRCELCFILKSILIFQIRQRPQLEDNLLLRYHW